MENSIENAQGTADPVEVPSQVTTVIMDCVMAPQEKPFDESNAARMVSQDLSREPLTAEYVKVI